MKADNVNYEPQGSDIAIIGLSGRFPYAENIPAFLENLKQGKDCTSPVSQQRITETGIPSLDYYTGGYLDHIDKFDYELFGLSKAEAVYMDPHQRISLQMVFEAIENAGYNYENFSGTRTSVYFSCPEFDYQGFVQDENPTTITGLSRGISPGRISRFFNLTGPAYFIDTTCSSSLVSAAQACNELLMGEAEMAIICAVNLLLVPPVKNPAKSDIGISSPDGKARAFSNKANGTSSGEGAGCLILKPLKQALQDKDHIHAVIKSAAINQDANRSSYLTAPSKIAQTEVIQRCWEKAGIDPETVTYIQCHGTGTKIGDPIEVDALNSAFASHTDRKHFCAISSVKSNIGHTNTAAGMAGLLATILSLKHNFLFPSLHFDEPNELIDFNQSAVYVNDKLRTWDSSPEHPRRAGVSAFGLGGTNCHMLLEEAPEGHRQNKLKTASCFFPFSANSRESLEDLLQLYTDFLEQTDLPLPNMANTLSKGRRHFPFRHSFIADSASELKKQILESLQQNPFQNLEPVKPARLIVLLTENEDISAEILERFSREFPAFHRALKSLIPDMAIQAVDKKYHYAIYQYCIARLFIEKGLRPDLMIGTSSSELIIDMLNGSISLAEGIEKLIAGNYQSGENAVENLQRFIAKESEKQPLVFLTFGANDPLTTHLQTVWSDSPVVKNISFCSLPEQKALLSVFQRLYEAGCDINWDGLMRLPESAKVELPTYVFRKDRCWVKLEEQEKSVEDMLHEVVWEKQALSPPHSLIRQKTFAIIGPRDRNIDRIKLDMEALDNAYIHFVPAKKYQYFNEKEIEFNPSDIADFERILEYLSANTLSIDGIIRYENSLDLASANFLSTPEAHHEFYILDWNIIHYFRNYLANKGFNFCRVFAKDTSSSSNILSSLQDSVKNIYRALQVDFPELKLSHIELTDKLDADQISSYVLNEISNQEMVRFSYFDESGRHIQQLRKLRSPGIKTAVNANFGENQVYLIAGGAGNIGTEITRILLEKASAKRIILLGRTDINADGLSAIRTLMEDNEKLTYIQADLSNSAALVHAMARIKEEFGKIDVVLNCAGIAGKWLPIGDKRFYELQEVLAPKLAGTINLWNACQEMEVKNLVLFSSLNAIVPHKHSLEYALANGFQDAFAANLKTSSCNIQSINWPVWGEVGAEKTRIKLADNEILKKLKTSTGLEALDLIIGSPWRHVVLAEADLERFKVNPFFTIDAKHTESSAVSESNQVPLSSFAAPSGAYHEASMPGGQESVLPVLLSIVEETLQTKNLTGEDDFFDLGGNSLNVVQIINQIEQRFGVELTIENFWDSNSFYELAVFIEQAISEVHSDEFVDSIEII